MLVEDRKTIKEPTRVVLPRFGVAIFDDSRESGWASLPDGEAMRFSSPHDLKSDCIWVTSADGSDFHYKWSRLHHLRASDYVSKLSYIASDFGLKVAPQGRFGGIAQRACSLLSPTVHRAMVIATQVYGWNDPASRLADKSLIESIRGTLFDEVAPPTVRANMASAFMAAFQNTSAPSWHDKFRTDRVSLTLRYNRLEYAQKILSTMVPEGAWIYEGSDVNTDFRCSIDRALDPEQPCLVNATVEYQGRDPDLACLAAFGSAAGKSPVLRTWISQRELAWLIQHARVHIHGIHYATHSRPLPVKVQLPEMLTSDPLFALSVSAGLVAESHWKALASPVRKRGIGDTVNPWSVWLRAADRALSFELALAAHKQGFFVSYYGNGSVLVNIERADLPKALDFALENEVAHPAFRTIFEDNGLVS